MIFKQLGNTSVKIPVIGQGTGGLSSRLAESPQKVNAFIDVLRLGIDLGITFFDTAEVYGGGFSEELIGKATQGIRDKVFIATKVSPEHLSYDALLRAVEGSLRRLNTDYIDLYQIHWSNTKVPIDDTMRAMARVLKNGQIRYVGVCNFSLKELKEAEAAFTDGEVVSIQLEYNLFDRTIENAILPYCENKDKTTIAYSPLDQGRICGSDRKIKSLEHIAKKYNKTIAQVTLNWLITHPSVIVIPRTANSLHVRENASSVDFELSEDDFKKIGKIFTEECMYIPVDSIQVITGQADNSHVYQTIEDAIENKLGFTPSPVDLAQNIKEGQFLKPVRVIPAPDKTGRYKYNLIEGRIRYWAWVIAHKGKVPIPAYVRDDSSVGNS